jgi:hypothetical protein
MLDTESHGEEQWRKEGDITAIFSEGSLVAVIAQGSGGRRETTSSAGQPFMTTYSFARPPRTLPNKSRLWGSFITTDNASRQTASCDMTATVRRTADSVTITYEIKSGEESIRHTLTYRNGSDLPEHVEHVSYSGKELTQYITKMKK